MSVVRLLKQEKEVRTVKWDLLTEAELEKIERSGMFPWAAPGEAGFALNRDPGPIWLIPPRSPDTGESQRPVCFLEMGDLGEVKTWQFLLAVAPAHPVDLAAYSHLHPEIDPEILLALLDQKIHYKSLADWKELGALDELSRELAREFDYPLTLLRLWNRLESHYRRAWLDLHRKRRIKKNLFKEIIQDFYDLEETRRADVLDQCIALAGQSDKKQLRGEELREILRRARYPRAQEVWEQVNVLKRAFPGDRGLRLEIPPHLEGDQLTLQLRFASLSELDRVSELIGRAEVRRTLSKILELL